ncbi:hypothetical protein PVAP13_2KG273201 [Panicum virgatum]|uniref:Uncharacterized protein n=1 Tax=Panicum virgatum TaxID=38727 RepID=A0A8T0W793_PANVG|nr:hypothetical protein PVAP13_2KG273201 [Panicum virgatum]
MFIEDPLDIKPTVAFEEGTVFIFSSCLCITDGAGAFCRHLPLSTEKKASTSTPHYILPEQHLKGGSDAKCAVVVRPSWSRFSPGQHTGEKRGGGASDAFKKIYGARGRRHHWPTSGPQAFACTLHSLHSRGNCQGVVPELKSAATTQPGKGSTKHNGWPGAGTGRRRPGARLARHPTGRGQRGGKAAHTNPPPPGGGWRAHDGSAPRLGWRVHERKGGTMGTQATTARAAATATGGPQAPEASKGVERGSPSATAERGASRPDPARGAQIRRGDGRIWPLATGGDHWRRGTRSSRFGGWAERGEEERGRQRRLQPSCRPPPTERLRAAVQCRPPPPSLLEGDAREGGEGGGGVGH